MAVLRLMDSWRCVGMETRIRCIDNNSYGEIGGGTWYWGFRTPTESLCFEAYSAESDPGYVGLSAVCRVNGTPVLLQPLPGIDIRQWHKYEILWGSGLMIPLSQSAGSSDSRAFGRECQGASSLFTFLVDGNHMAWNYRSPEIMAMDVVIGLGNEARHGVYGDSSHWVENIDIHSNVSMQIDHISVFDFHFPEQLHLSVAAILILLQALLHRRN
jgi:hypothetical protein